MKRTTFLIITFLITIVFAQEKEIVMQRVESLSWIEAYPVGKIVSINGLGDIFAVSAYNSVYVLKNGSSTWTQILYPGGTVTGIYTSDDNSLFVSTSSGLYYSTNTSTYSLTQILVETNAFSVAENSSGTIFCGSSDGLYKSVNNGTSWSITYEYPLKMAINSSDVMYIEEYNKGLCRSIDNGTSWEEINYNLSKDIVINDIQIAVDGTVVISVKDNGIYKLNGTEWISQGFNYANVNSIHAGKNGLLYCSLGDKIYKKTVAMTYWIEIKSTQGKITTFSSNSSKLIAGYTDNLYIFESTDWGTTWTTNGQVIYPTVLSILTVNNYVFVGTDSGIFKSADYGVTWSTKQLSFPVFDIELERYGRVALGTDDGLYRSSDFGLTWVKRTCPVGEIHKVLFTSDYKYYASGYWDIYKSLDYGSVWTNIPDGSNFYKPYDIVKLSTGRLFIADPAAGIWYSDNESTWTNTGVGASSDIESNAAGDVFASRFGIKVLRSGQTAWETCYNVNMFDIFVCPDQMILGCATSSWYYSTDSGITWTSSTIGLPASTSAEAITKDLNGYVYVGMASAKGLYKSGTPLTVK